MALFGRTTSSDSSNGDEYGKWVAADAVDMTEFDQARQAPATTRTPAKAADILDALLGNNN
jgi:hypothetical protein